MQEKIFIRHKKLTKTTSISCQKALTKEVLLNGFQAIEMEGAAVAQVCVELQVPFVVVRAIADKADAEASVDFTTFVDLVASRYSLGILKEYFEIKQEKPEDLLLCTGKSPA